MQYEPHPVHPESAERDTRAPHFVTIITKSGLGITRTCLTPSRLASSSSTSHAETQSHDA